MNIYVHSLECNLVKKNVSRQFTFIILIHVQPSFLPQL